MRLLTMQEAAKWLADGKGGSVKINGLGIGDWLNYDNEGLEPQEVYEHWLQVLQKHCTAAKNDVWLKRSSSGKWDNNDRKTLGCSSLTAQINNASVGAHAPARSERGYREEISDANTMTDLFKATLNENNRINEMRFREVAARAERLEVSLKEVSELNAMLLMALMESQGGASAEGLQWERLRQAVSKRLPQAEKTLRGFVLDPDVSSETRSLANDGLIAIKGLRGFLEEPAAPSHPATPTAA